MYSNLSIDATCFFNITLRLHIPGIMSNFIDCLSHNFTEMKKALCVIFVMLAGLVSCKYDDSEIWNKVNENEARIAALEEQCRGFNQDLQTLRTIVNALQGNDYVTGVVEVIKEGTVVGYSITFSKSGTVTIYNGKDGHSPVIGIRQHTDGKYYWTVDGEWIYDGSGTGNRINAGGTAPELKIEDGWWYVSYDGRKTWTKLSKATGEDGDSFFSSVTDNGDTVTVTLMDGTVFELAKKSSDLSIRFPDYGTFRFNAGETRSVVYKILNATGSVVVKAFAQNGWKAGVKRNNDSEGEIVVTSPSPFTGGEVVVLVYDDSKTIVRCLDFVGGNVITPQETYSMSRGAGEIAVTVSADVDYSVDIPEDAASWLRYSGLKTRAMRQDELVFHCDRNEGESARSAVVGIVNKAAGIHEKVVIFQEGIVHTLQTHSVGNGIKIVIMGDGFTKDDLTASEGESMSSFDKWADRTMEEFFAEEPYRSFRDRFDVYSVAVESDGRNFDGSTAFASKFGTGTYIGGNDSKVWQYAYKVDGISRLTVRNTLELVILNSSKYAGTTYMWSDGRAIAYIPVVSYNTEAFGKVLRHEAGGHGFAKLADEYFYEKTITEDKVKSHKEWFAKYGFYPNADVTNDPKEIHWAHFLSDPRYSGQVGIYDGGLTFRYGAYRPTDYSIMRHNAGGFNAPSREAIFKRIMKLSEPSGWKYDFEAFVAYDEINRSAASQAYYENQMENFDEESFVPLAPPVVREE